MEDEYYKFNPGTNTCHAPLPTKFDHALKFVTKAEQFLTIHNQEDITNVNSLLEQTLNLQVSNIIQRVIAQVIGEHGDGFVTIKGTEDGALHVYPAGGSTDGIIDVLLAAGTNLIGKIQLDTGTASIGYLAAGANVIGKVLVQGHAETILSAPITISGDQVHDIIAADGTKQHHICSIMFTVAGDVTITLRDETDLLSGAMNLGGTGEAMGMCHTHDLAPLICHAGEKFQITLDAAVQVSGYVTYYSK